MSQVNTYNIECPQCGSPQDVALYDSMNVEESPELKDALMSNQLNAITCAHCAFSFRVDKALLYNDPRKNVMVYWIPYQRKTFQYTMQELTELFPPGLGIPDIHWVNKRTELIERIFLLEAGLNERIIEYIKYIIYTKNLDQLNPAAKALLFNTQDSTDRILYFVVQDLASQKLESMLEYSRDAYNALYEMFDRDEKTPTLLELFPGPYISARDLLLSEAAAPISDH